MEVKLTKYQGNKNDREAILSLIEELQDYLVGIDPLKELRRKKEFGKIYVKKLISKIIQSKGVIYLAKFNDVTMGMIAGIIEQQTARGSLENLPTKSARVLELIVSKKYQGKKIGYLLMQKIEKYFKIKRCKLVRIEVFVPNKNAHSFYQKLGYSDRAIDLIKKF